MKNKFSLHTLLFIAAFLLLPAIVKAGPGFGTGGTTDTPIDGGLSALVVAGVGYGVKKMRDARANSKNSKSQIPNSKIEE